MSRPRGQAVSIEYVNFILLIAVAAFQILTVVVTARWLANQVEINNKRFAELLQTVQQMNRETLAVAEVRKAGEAGKVKEKEMELLAEVIAKRLTSTVPAPLASPALGTVKGP